MAGILCLIITLSISTAISIDKNEGPTPNFIEMCSKFFNDTSTYKALDKSDHDVTQKFYNAHIAEYQNEDYDALLKAFLEELSAFSWDNNDV